MSWNAQEALQQHRLKRHHKKFPLSNVKKICRSIDFRTFGWNITQAFALQYAQRYPLRMWLLPPEGMCILHLKQEAKDIAEAVRLLCRYGNQSLFGYYHLGYLECLQMKRRYAYLGIELKTRQEQKLKDLLSFDPYLSGYIHVEHSLSDLHNHCARCWNLYRKQVLKRVLKEQVKWQRVPS